MPVLHRSPAAARVARGVRFLDQERPGWRDAISLDRLDIACARHCILGQLYGTFSAPALELGPITCYRLGFLGPDPLFLNAAWRDAIHAGPVIDEEEEEEEWDDADEELNERFKGFCATLFAPSAES